MNLFLVSSFTEEQLRQLHALYQHEWWTKGRTIDEVRRMLAHSPYVFGLCDPDTQQLVAFARVLTDRAFEAFIFDVIVAPSYRSQGVGEALLDRVLAHPDLASVQHFELYCLPELIPFYARWGFSPDAGGVVLLRRQRNH